MTLKSFVLPRALILAGITAYSAAHAVAAFPTATSAGQMFTATSHKVNSGNHNSSAKSKAPGPLDCSCTGTGCSCSCSGPGCVCACDGGNCSCKNFKATTLSLKSGTTVNEVAKEVSALTGENFVVLSGGEQTIPLNIENTTPWQAVARLIALPHVRIGRQAPLSTEEALGEALRSVEQSIRRADTGESVAEEVESASRSLLSSNPAAPTGETIVEMHPLPENEVVSLCVDDADLSAALDSLSYVSRTAFEVSGSASGKFTVKAKGTVAEILRELGRKTGTTITPVP